MRSTAWALLLVASTLSACSGSQGLPPTTLSPPAIEAVGIVSSSTTDSATATYVFTDGRTFSTSTVERRLLTPSWSGKLVIAGNDQTGHFLAAYSTQQGLPEDCYVDNTPGIDRGVFIELRGVLWPKAPAFTAAQPRVADVAYPDSTRFCFDGTGEIKQTIGP